MVNFEKIDDEIVFSVNGRIAYRAETIGLVLDTHLSMVKMHGPSDVICKFYNDMENKISNTESLPVYVRERLLADMVCVSGCFDVADLNALVLAAGAVDQFVQKEADKANAMATQLIELAMMR